MVDSMNNPISDIGHRFPEIPLADRFRFWAASRWPRALQYLRKLMQHGPAPTVVPWTNVAAGIGMLMRSISSRS